MTKRLDPAVRRQELLDVAVEVASARGWRTLTRECIAVAAGVSPALVSARLGTMAELRRAVMRAAIRKGIAAIVAEGLVAGDPHARKAPEEIKRAAAAYICA